MYNGKEITEYSTTLDESFYSDSALDLLNNYKDFLIYLTGDKNIEVGLMTIDQLRNSGCDIDSDGFGPCSSINSFLVLSGQKWWALYVNKNDLLLCVGSNSVFSVSLDSSYGIRPIITVSREALKKKIISFTIEGTTYYAEEGMYWTDWVNSSYNTDGFTISQDELNFRVLPSGSVCFVNPNAASDSLLEDGADYTLSCEGGRE